MINTTNIARAMDGARVYQVWLRAALCAASAEHWVDLRAGLACFVHQLLSTKHDKPSESGRTRCSAKPPFLYRLSHGWRRRFSLGFLLLAFIRLRRSKRQAALPERHIHVLGKFVSSSSFLFIFLGKLASQIQDVLNSSGKSDSSNTFLFNNFIFQKKQLARSKCFYSWASSSVPNYLCV